MRMIFGLANPDASYNDSDRIYELLTALGESQAKTRGAIGKVKAGFNFYKAMESSIALPRYAGLGVIKKAGINIKDSKVRRELFAAVRVESLPKDKVYNVKDFWTDFSTGKLDRYAPAIFKDIYYTGALSGGGNEYMPSCEAFQNYYFKSDHTGAFTVQEESGVVVGYATFNWKVSANKLFLWITEEEPTGELADSDKEELANGVKIVYKDGVLILTSFDGESVKLYPANR